jgi:hypothetical protein
MRSYGNTSCWKCGRGTMARFGASEPSLCWACADCRQRTEERRKALAAQRELGDNVPLESLMTRAGRVAALAIHRHELHNIRIGAIKAADAAGVARSEIAQRLGISVARVAEIVRNDECMRSSP